MLPREAVRRSLDLDKSTKSAGRDSRRPRRLQHCVNQDCSRGRNYTSNRGCHATFNGSVRLDTSGTRLFVEAVRDAYSRCGHVYLTVACVLPWQVFQRLRLQSPEGRLSREGDINRRRGLYSQAGRKMPGALSFPRPAATVSQARWRDGNNFRGRATTGTSPREEYGLLECQNILRKI